MKDGLWGIVNESEAAPAEDATAEVKAKYQTRKDRALATIVLSIEPSLLYLLGDPSDPVVVWKTLSNQFQRKTWGNKLVLRRKLHSMKLTADNSVQEHVKRMTEVFNELAVVGATLEEEDKVIYLLASLPEAYNTLVTALEANKDVPTMEIVTERLLHEERKLLERKTTDSTTNHDKAMTTSHKKPKKGPKCYYCHKTGHIQRNCTLKQKREAEEETRERRQLSSRVNKISHKANTVSYRDSDPQSDSESIGLVVRHALSVEEERGMIDTSPSLWIVDSGATAHICTCERMFDRITYLDRPQKVTLGDGSALNIKGRGDVTLVEMVRSMLSDSKAPSRFWAEALSTAAYIRNRCPTKAVEGMTPIEALTGKKPDIAHLRRFGCAAYAHIPKDERQKLNPKVRKCILVGYGVNTKGYRLYDPNRERIIHCRDVTFNEADTSIEKEFKLHEEHGIRTGDSRVMIDWTDQEPETTTENIEGDTDEVTHSRGGESTDTGPRRSSRERRQAEFYGEWVNSAVCDTPEPTTVKEALSGADKEKWKAAMDRQLQSIEKNEVWELESTLPKGKMAIGTKWVFKRKLNADGEVERYKARLVALGYSQQHGADYDDTFCPVVRFESVRMLIAIAVQLGLKLHQMDITAAFLNGDLKEDVYLSSPEGLEVNGSRGKVFCKLKKSLYGLRQSPRCWNSTLDAKLREMGFRQTPSDPCMYITSSEGKPLILAVYVDDIILAGKSEKLISEVKRKLAQYFEVKDLGILHHFLGVKVSYNEETGSVWIGQPRYTEKVLEKFGMDKAKPNKTPVSSSSRLRRRNDEEEGVDRSLYQSAVGSSLYLSTRTRLDISFAVSNVAKYCNDPSKEHWIAVKRILRYLNGSTHLGLLYTKQDPKEVIGYSDADWGGDNDDHRSTSGYIFQIGGTAISWSSRKQSSVALSAAEAEYMALSSATQEAVWLRQLYTDLFKDPIRPTVVYEDNQACISMAENPKFHGRAKHINLKYHYIREQIGKSIELVYCPTNEMVADVLTKGLSQEKFLKLRSLCGIDYQPT